MGLDPTFGVNGSLSETLELAVFAAVARLGSFVKAAEERGITASAVSRIVSRLEDRLGARLFQRTTRRLSLTEAGMIFHERAVQILGDLAEAEAEVTSRSVSPKGVVKISAPVVFGRLHLMPTISRLAVRYPEISIDLNLTDRFVDLVDEGIDLAIRIGSLTDSRLVARRLCANKRVLVASPSYLEHHGVPQRLEDLQRHECLIFSALPRPKDWRLVNESGPRSIGISGRFSSSNGEIITEMAKEGFGIGLGATFSIGLSLMSRELVRVLPEYEFAPTSIHVVYPSARQLSSKVRAVVDQFTQDFRDPAAWDRRLDAKLAHF